MTDQIIFGLSFVEHLSYIGIFFSVAFSGYLLPIPEEIILILGGFLSAEHISNLYIVMTVSILGAVFGDTIIYSLSSRGSHYVEKYRNKIELSKAGWYMRNMRKHTFMTIFLSRFIVGMRFLNPLVSGLMKVKLRTFATASFLSALIYIPIIIFLGFHFHDQITTVLHIAHSIRRVLLILLGLGSVILIILFIHNLIEERE